MLDLLEDHFDELDFLWEQRERYVFDFDYDLPGLADLERRASAHLAGLKLGGEHANELVTPHLAGEAVGAATAATFTLVALGNADTVDRLMTAFVAGPPEVREGMRIALHHVEPGRFARALTEHASSANPAVAVAAMEILAFHRMLSVPVPQDWLHHEDPAVRGLTMQTVGRVGSGPWTREVLGATLGQEDLVLRRLALETSARVGMPDLSGACRRAATRPADPVPEALAFLGRVGDLSDLPLLTSCLGRPELATAALEALGALGRTQAIPYLIDAMTKAELAHAAGAAFRRITGADDIDADAPLPPPPGTSEEDADFLDTSLPPDAERARHAWESERHRFDEGGVWQAGIEVSRDPLGEAFDRLPLSCRRDVYLRARAADAGGTPVLELERRAEVQLREGRQREG